MHDWVKQGVLLATRLSEWSLLKAVRQGLMYSLPLVLIGAICTLLLNFPLLESFKGVSLPWGGLWGDTLRGIRHGTLSIISLTVLIGVSHAIFSSDKSLESSSHIAAILVVLGSYLLFIGSDSSEWLTLLSNQGLFLSINFALLVSYLFLWLYRHRLIRFRLYTHNPDDLFHGMLKLIEPAFWVFVVVALLKALGGSYLSGEVNLAPVSDFLSGLPFYLAGVLYQMGVSIFWFGGFHGNNLLEPVMLEVFGAFRAMNQELISLGGLPEWILTREFFEVFVHVGGTGATLSLLIALWLKGSRGGTAHLAKLSLLPALFNINELLIFGLPIIFNPFFLIPFLLTPLLFLSTSYLAMEMGWVPLVTHEVSWTTPIFIGGYIATGSLAGSILQGVNLILGFFLYLPFVVAYERYRHQSSEGVLHALAIEVSEGRIDQSVSILSLKDERGALSRELVGDLSSALLRRSSELFVLFQPQVAYDGRVVGAEALFRWRHEREGMIPPPLGIRLAEEAGLMDGLGSFIIESGFKEKAKWEREGKGDLWLSLNLSVAQIENPQLPQEIERLAREQGIDLKGVKFELTETAAFTQTQEICEGLMAIKALGARLAIDDFGMGASSLFYIKEFGVEIIKLDRVLVEDILSDANSRGIVASVATLCKELHLSLIAEFVESAEQVEILHKLGCSLFQGYHFAPPLSSQAFDDFLSQRATL